MDSISGRVVEVLGEGRFDMVVRLRPSFNKRRYRKLERVQAVAYESSGDFDWEVGPWLEGCTIEVDVFDRDDFGVLRGRFRVTDDSVSQSGAP